VLGLSGTSDLPPPPRELPSKAARDPYATGLGTRIFRPIATIVSGTAAVLALVQFGGQLVERRITLAPDSPIPPWIRRAGDAVLDQVEWACVVEHPFREGDLRVDQMRFGGLLAWLQPFRTLNTYGLF